MYNEWMALLRRFETLPVLDRIFDVSVLLKGLDGILEIIGGLLVFFITPDRLNRVVHVLTQNELSQDPHDYIANHTVQLAHTYTGSVSWFLGLYLLSHGLVKVVLVVAVLKQKLWAYPWMIAFLAVFILYQLYRLYLRLSFGLILLTLFDGFIVYLTVLEYRKHLRQRSIET